MPGVRRPAERPQIGVLAAVPRRGWRRNRRCREARLAELLREALTLLEAR
jgi:hypothetical protein